MIDEQSLLIGKNCVFCDKFPSLRSEFPLRVKFSIQIVAVIPCPLPPFSIDPFAALYSAVLIHLLQVSSPPPPAFTKCLFNESPVPSQLVSFATRYSLCHSTQLSCCYYIDLPRHHSSRNCSQSAATFPHVLPRSFRRATGK